MTSPCDRVCKLGMDGLCISCKRTKQEIAQWALMNETDRKKIMNQLKERQIDSNK